MKTTNETTVKEIKNERNKFFDILKESGYDVEDMGYPSVICEKEDMGAMFDKLIDIAKANDYKGTYGVRARRT